MKKKQYNMHLIFAIINQRFQKILDIEKYLTYLSQFKKKKIQFKMIINNL